MIVCSCNVISDCEVRSMVDAQSSAITTAQIYRGLGHQPQCGRCARSIRKIVNEMLPAEADQS